MSNDESRNYTYSETDYRLPVSCLLYVLYVLFDWKSLRLLAARLTAFGLLIFLVIPASVYVSDLIEDSYQASIEATIETARDAAAELESESETAGEGEKGFFSGLISTVTDGVSGITDKVGEMVNRFMEALAVMLVTCCAIPVLVLLSFLWFAKILLSVELPVSYSGIHHGLKDRLFRKKRGAGGKQESSSAGPLCPCPNACNMNVTSARRRVAGISAQDIAPGIVYAYASTKKGDPHANLDMPRRIARPAPGPDTLSGVCCPIRVSPQQGRHADTSWCRGTGRR